MDNKDLDKKIQELQILEQTLQSSLIEKQNLQVELNEVLNAITEVEKTKEEVYKILGGIMVKSNKDSLLKELSEKNKVLDLKIVSIEKQEALMTSKLQEMKKEINLLMPKK